MTEGARAQYYIGRNYTHTPTEDNPVWLIVHNYTKKDINKSANQDDFLHCKFDFPSQGWGTEPVALLRYNFEYHPEKYFYIYDDLFLNFVRQGSMSGKNPNGLDLLNISPYKSSLVKTKDVFRDWWTNLKDNVEKTSNKHPDGRAELIRQMSKEGIIDCINNDDIPAALYLIKSNESINYVNWGDIRDGKLIPLLENGLNNHYHLMDDEQKKRFSPYVPPADYTTSTTIGSGTTSGTMPSGQSGMTIIQSV